MALAVVAAPSALAATQTQHADTQTTSFSQRVTIPEDNVLAVLALRNAGIGWGDGSWGWGDGSGSWGCCGLLSVANFDRSFTSTHVVERHVSLDRDDVLLWLALGGGRVRAFHDDGFFDVSDCIREEFRLGVPLIC